MIINKKDLSYILYQYENESTYLRVNFNSILPIVLNESTLDIVGNWFDFKLKGYDTVTEIFSPSDISYLNLITFILKCEENVYYNN